MADSVGWFTAGRARKRAARELGRCVECFGPLPSPRAQYCSRACRWRFHGRYFWDAARTVVFRRDRYTCRHCGRRYPRRHLEVDHVLEIAAGGAALDYANLQTLCKPCHRAKTSSFLRGRPRRAGARLPEDDAPEWFPS